MLLCMLLALTEKRSLTMCECVSSGGGVRVCVIVGRFDSLCNSLCGASDESVVRDSGMMHRR